MRFLKATIIIGLVATIAILILDASGWLRTLEVVTAAALDRLSVESLAVGSRGLGYLIAAVVAFAVAWTTVDIVRPLGRFFVAAAAIVLLATGSVVLSLYGTFISPYPAILATALSFLIGLLYSRSDAGTRKRVLQDLFGRRVSGRALQQLIDSDVPMDFPGTEHDATVLVCEVHNHVELMEELTPEDYVLMTNLYLTTAADYLVEVGGYLDESGGESLRVVFGAPLAREDHAALACKAALELTARVETLNRECDQRWHQRLDFRVGINSGPMIAAAYGGTRLAAFSVAGPAVEFARRLCAACAAYGCRILIGPGTFSEVRDGFEARPIEMLRRADNRRIELYEVLAAKNGLSPERVRSRDHFWKGVIYFREKKWEPALEEFAKARITGIADPALEQYVLRTERARRGEPITNETQMSLAEIR